MSASSSAPSPPAAAGLFPGARTLFRVRGVPVRVDGSWLVIAGLFLLFLFQYVSGAVSGASPLVMIVAAVAGTLLFSASILAHELGHAWASLNRGLPVAGITLFGLGGVTESGEAESAKDEFVIVGIGPLVSLVLAALFWLATFAAGAFPLVAAVTGYLALINLLLAVFNVLPGYPLDGGRILRSILWGATGRPHQATRWAARVGQVFALGLAAWGVWGLVIDRPGAFNALWRILVGYFLFRGAADSHRRARLQERLARRTARERMGSVPQALDPDMPLDEAVLWVRQRPSLPWPVGTPLAGVVLLEQIEAVPSSAWPLTRVRDVALPLAGRTVGADTPMGAVMQALTRAPGQTLVVTDGGSAVGLLTPSLVAD
ncbi:MAG: site-2 protease family protein [Egibacteraceae bacterium]